MKKYILALDQGTTSSRAILFDHGSGVVALAQQEFQQHFPRTDWVEHDAEEIWHTQLAVMRQALRRANVSAEEIAAIGITNQRETTVVWDRGSGKPVARAIVWQDRRTADFCESLNSNRAAAKIQRKTGLRLDPYFSATKIKWILDHIPGAREKANAGRLAFGAIDSWLLWNLTGGKAHFTDVTNASRTMLFDIHRCVWDEELLALFDIPASLLPEVRSCSELLGETAPELLGAAVPISGMAGDQQAALFGQMCTEPGMIKNTYGTGCFLVLNTGEKPVVSKNNLLTTIAWRLDGKTIYALEGSVFIGGAVVQWLRDGLGVIKASREVEALAKTVADNGGVYLVPAFVGLGAPHWDAFARGILIGLTRGTTSGHIARAALEGIAFQTSDVLAAMRADADIDIRELRVDGGATANNLLMQFQADLLGVSVVRPKVAETTALGAAYFAGLAVGFWQDVETLRAHWKMDCDFRPDMPRSQADKLLERWHAALERTKGWAKVGA